MAKSILKQPVLQNSIEHWHHDVNTTLSSGLRRLNANVHIPRLAISHTTDIHWVFL